MTDLQLSILLDKYARLIEAEIESIEQAADRETMPDAWGEYTNILNQGVGYFCVFTEGLRSLESAIREDVEALREAKTK